METIRMNYGSEYKLRVNYNRYRVFAILSVYWTVQRTGGRTMETVAVVGKLLYVPFVSRCQIDANYYHGFRGKIVGKLMVLINKTLISIPTRVIIITITSLKFLRA
jgi:hypothetical protein